MSSALHKWWPLFFLALLLPFIKRPLFFDDPSVHASALGAARHPLTPYDFRLDLALPGTPAWSPPSTPAYTHPPLSAWILAVPARFGGETAERAVMFLLAFLAVLTSRKLLALAGLPETAAVLFSISPAFFLTSLTLYPHLFYFLFYVATLWAGLKIAAGEGSAFLLGASMALAALSLHQWPLLVVLVVSAVFYKGGSSPKVRSRLFGGLAVFMLLYGSWCFWEIRCYGEPHIWATYRVRAQGEGYNWLAAFLPPVFLAGAGPFIAVAWLFLFQSRRRLSFLFAGLVPACALFFSSRWGGFSPGQALLLALFLSTAGVFLTALIPFWRRGSRADRLCIVWFLSEYLFAQRFFVYPSGHHLLPAALAAAALAVRLAQLCDLGPVFKRGGVALLALWTLLLAHADLSEAKVGLRLAADVPARPGHSFYWGNSFGGFEHYLSKAGWKAYDPRLPLGPGDRILVPQNMNVQGPPEALKGFPLMVERKLVYRQWNPLRTFSLGDSAGWYSASWGALPYSVSRKPVEEFLLLAVAER